MSKVINLDSEVLRRKKMNAETRDLLLFSMGRSIEIKLTVKKETLLHESAFN